MSIIFFAHPDFLGSQSMPRFTNMLAENMQERGWKVRIIKPGSFFSRIRIPQALRKWLSYIDQFILFPFYATYIIRRSPKDTLFVITDHALGPYVPLVSRRPHIIHCHDFLAQASAKGVIEDNKTRFFGRIYQKYIHRGYSAGKHFVCVSSKTREDLKKFLGRTPETCEVVYNGLNNPALIPRNPKYARKQLGGRIKCNLAEGYILHVGGNQWYKNRTGVVAIYDAWRRRSQQILPLLLVGKIPDKKLNDIIAKSAYKSDIYVLTDLPNEWMPFAYSGATVLLFPSLAEGFGWPISEAMACGCPVITTDAAPMTEVAGSAASLIPRKPSSHDNAWAADCARELDRIINLTPEERAQVVEAGIVNATRFNTAASADNIDKLYRNVLDTYFKSVTIDPIRIPGHQKNTI